MKIGEKGKEVREVQTLLAKNGFLSFDDVDGDFGKKTHAAVILFQRSKKLHQDGIVGPDTLAALKGDKVATITKKVFTDDALDARTNKVLSTLDPKAIEKFIPFIQKAKEIAASMGYTYLALSGHRGEKEQNDLYAQGRTKPGDIVTNATFGYSNHNFGIALDFGVFKDGKYVDELRPAESTKVHKAVAAVAHLYGMDAGAFWTSIKDYPHFEVKTSLSMSQKRDLYKKKGSVL